MIFGTRHRQAGVLVLLATVVALGGCQALAPGALVNAAGSMAAGQPSAAPSSPASVAASPAAAQDRTPVQALVLAGVVSLKGAPLAGAHLHVVDAMTGEPLAIVAAGAGNFISHNGSTIVAQGGGNIVAQGAGNVVSNDGGSFRLAVAGLGPGHVARVVASDGSHTLSCLVAADAARGYALAAAPDALVPTGEAAFNAAGEVTVAVTPATTLTDAAFTPLLAVLARLTPAARATELGSLMASATAVKSGLEQQVAAHPELADGITTQADPASAALPAAFVASTLASTGTIHTVQDDAKVAVQAVATAEQDAHNVVATSRAIDQTATAGMAAIGLTMTPDGQLSLGSQVIAVAPPPPSPAPTPVPSASADTTTASAAPSGTATPSPTPSASATSLVGTATTTTTTTVSTTTTAVLSPTPAPSASSATPTPSPSATMTSATGSPTPAPTQTPTPTPTPTSTATTNVVTGTVGAVGGVVSSPTASSSPLVQL